MKWYRTLRFKKRKIYKENDCYEIISDSSITSSVLNIANSYDLKIKKIDCSDYFDCTIVLWGSKETFLLFVDSFVEDYKKYITELSF